MSARLRLVLGSAPAGFEPLLGGAEYELVLPELARRLASPADLGARLQLETYEFLERLRAAAGSPLRRRWAPFWPPALCAAYGLPTLIHGELLALRPAHLEVTYSAPNPSALLGELARRGLPSLDPERYRRALEHCATAERWRRRFERPPPIDGPVERSTAAAVILDAGRVLLERRPPDAQVTPNTWDIPGGHLHADETPEAALLRELHEELGLRLPDAAALQPVADFTNHEPPARRRYRHHVFALDLSQLPGQTPAALEGQNLAWFDLSAALELADLNPPTGYALERFYDSRP
jgi:8-oxo-dGTP diphosphatase